MNRYLTLSWIAFAAMGIIIVGFLFLIFGIDLSGPPKILLPDSAILQPVLDSPEGKAFTTRYPDYKASVLQDFYMSRCCQITLWYYPPTTNSRPAIQLLVYVSVSGDLKTISVDNDIQLRCIVSEGSWAIKGDIVQNLQPDKPDCWKSGPPPKEFPDIPYQL